MIVDAEKKLQALENEIKALKAIYTISGGNMKTFLSYSDVYTINDEIAESPIKIKFKADYGDGNILVTSFFVEQTAENFTYNLSQWSIALEQTEDGAVVFEIPLIVAVDTIQVGIATTVPGTFTRI